MEWPEGRIDAAFCTLSDALGDICDVSIDTSAETEEIEPVVDETGQGWRQWIITGRRKAIITITMKDKEE